MTDPRCGRCNDQGKRPGQGIVPGCPAHDPEPARVVRRRADRESLIAPTSIPDDSAYSDPLATLRDERDVLARRVRAVEALLDEWDRKKHAMRHALRAALFDSAITEHEHWYHLGERRCGMTMGGVRCKHWVDAPSRG